MTSSDIIEMPKFFDRYIRLVESDQRLVEILHNEKQVFQEVKSSLVVFQNHQYQPGKWSPLEILQHVIDTERILTYRALCISRGEQTSLPGFNEDSYARHANGTARSVNSLLAEFDAVRNSTIHFFESLNEPALQRTGSCNHIQISVLALGFVIIGHSRHHLNILNDRYFDSEGSTAQEV